MKNSVNIDALNIIARKDDEINRAAKNLAVFKSWLMERVNDYSYIDADLNAELKKLGFEIATTRVLTGDGKFIVECKLNMVGTRKPIDYRAYNFRSDRHHALVNKVISKLKANAVLAGFEFMMNAYSLDKSTGIIFTARNLTKLPQSTF